MKILIISRGYPTKKYPMHGIFEFDQAKAIAALGHDVIFITVDIRSLRRFRKFGIEKTEKSGIKIYGINYPLGRVPYFISNYFLAKGLKKIYRIVEIEHGIYDLMHSHFPEISLASTKLKKINEIPLVITEHSSSLMHPKIDENFKKIALNAYKHANQIISVSPSLQSVLRDKFNVDSVYVPNIVDIGNFKFYQRKETNNFRFISVGSLIERKRMDLIIKAFKNAFYNNDKVELVIIGTGPQKKYLEDLILESGLNNKVFLLGSLERNEIAKEMNNSDCFVLPSAAETFGVVYIEAMATGLPIIATKCGGPEIFTNETNGILINVDDLKGLEDALIDMYNNSELFDKKKISDWTNHNFSPKTVAEQIVAVYNKVLDN